MCSPCGLAGRPELRRAYSASATEQCGFAAHFYAHPYADMGLDTFIEFGSTMRVCEASKIWLNHAGLPSTALSAGLRIAPRVFSAPCPGRRKGASRSQPLGCSARWLFGYRWHRPHRVGRGIRCLGEKADRALGGADPAALSDAGGRRHARRSTRRLVGAHARLTSGSEHRSDPANTRVGISCHRLRPLGSISAPSA
jgi:hypothetical protein